MTDKSGLRLVPEHAIPTAAGDRRQWGRLYGSSPGLAMAELAQKQPHPVVLVCDQTAERLQLEKEIGFFLQGGDLVVEVFPDWETLPYDQFSPYQDIISQRLWCLQRLQQPGFRGVVVTTTDCLLQRIAPRDYLMGQCFDLKTTDRLDLGEFQTRLTAAGYQRVPQVMEHGDFAVRGNLLDLFPMGSDFPVRIDLFDDEIESIRNFDTENQRSLENLDSFRLLPGREFPFHEKAITFFRQAFRAEFEGDPQRSSTYRDVSQGIMPAGVEYYLPLFFQRTETLLDYLPAQAIVVHHQDLHDHSERYWKEVEQRYEQYRHDNQRPVLAPQKLFLKTNELFECLKSRPRIVHQSMELDEKPGNFNLDVTAPPRFHVDPRSTKPLQSVSRYIQDFPGRVLFVADSLGRQETLVNLLQNYQLSPRRLKLWRDFIHGDDKLAIAPGILDHGLQLNTPALAIICENQLFGHQNRQQRQRRARERDADAVIRNLAELRPGDPVVHLDYGVGRYLGLETMTVGDHEAEFLALEYAEQDKLYVPVAGLQLISRYTGAHPETAPLHRLGGDQWQKARRKASEKIKDVAIELLDLYAQRAARKGYAIAQPDEQYQAFVADFPFEETPDQALAIEKVIEDMTGSNPMDRVVCGDVGFGKTEVAMRATFLMAMAGRQVAILVPTTLLAQQHFQNFQDRFANWPVEVDVLSRFKTKKQQDQIIERVNHGKVDVIIGTHKLIQGNIQFNNLGLVIIDEEHRFGVRQKEKLKALRAQVDVLTLTATPIPRTLNMALANIRDLSIIATPPARRLTIKTFVRQWHDGMIQEACMREIKRGGQVFFLHNEVDSIENMRVKLEALLPEARIQIAHGQLRERELEQVMLDFYHRRFQILLCTTIIETGIDIPNCNTIVINRADRFGLAQLHQLRGRVGRSHRRAYAYLVVPPRAGITRDAIKRLEAIESLEDLGAGFTLATHDLEIRGAGELLGDEQSGQIHEIGYTLYCELLERAVRAIRSGKQPELDQPFVHGTEIDMDIAALIPQDYLPDIHSRLIMYKRISNATGLEELDELQVEMIDRFGLLPEPLKNLVRMTEVKIKAQDLGIDKIELRRNGGTVHFNEKPKVNPLQIVKLVQTQSHRFKLSGQNKLRIIMDFEDVEARFNALEKLLEILAKPQES